MSRSSCTSNTDSTCSTLSLTSSSTMKLENSLASRCSNDGSRWVKCDSFEELPLQDSPQEKVMHKVCISTFVDKHVRTASVYDAVSIQKSSKSPSLTSTSSTTNVPSNPKYVTSSLSTPTSGSKASDVRRTPSLNVCSTSTNIHGTSVNKIFMPDVRTPQKPIRQYAANVQSHPSSHGRTATRIGVSSLSRDQRLPLTLFSDQRILACGSEPNLYAPVNDCSPISLSDHVALHKSQLLQQNLNSRSEMSLNVMANQSPPFKAPVLPNHQHCDSRPRQLSLPDVCSDVVDGDFPCIPPPPAYRNNDIAGTNVPVQCSPHFQLAFSSNERVSS